MEIRDANAADRDTIVALDDVARSDSRRIRFIDRILECATCLVAERQHTVVAYAALEYTFYEQGFIPILYVAEPARRQGVGRALMQVLASRCKTRKLFTSTNQSNRPMQHLLHAMGYVPSGIIHNLDAGDPELVYMLDLGVGAAYRAGAADKAAKVGPRMRSSARAIFFVGRLAVELQ